MFEIFLQNIFKSIFFFIEKSSYWQVIFSFQLYILIFVAEFLVELKFYFSSQAHKSLFGFLSGFLSNFYEEDCKAALSGINWCWVD